MILIGRIASQSVYLRFARAVGLLVAKLQGPYLTSPVGNCHLHFTSGYINWTLKFKGYIIIYSCRDLFFLLQPRTVCPVVLYVDTLV